MEVLQYKCTLLSDIILNAKSYSEGSNRTLDFIPGNCFLGIVADVLYDKNSGYDKFIEEIVHSGKVRFGDAHPVSNNGDNIRSIKIPNSFFLPKGKEAPYYVYHKIADMENPDIVDKQLKQCRNGFYGIKLTNNRKYTSSLFKVLVPRSTAIKSAYNKDLRRSEDEKMYGYESLSKGQSFYFEIEIDETSLKEKVEDIFGKKGESRQFRIGRSRTAQYGLAKFEQVSFDGCMQVKRLCDIPTGKSISKCVTIYADGRLIFLDECGLPTYRPTVSQLFGIKDGDKVPDAEIMWEKSQIRTFKYSPWNLRRQSFDADRCGIEKGSVFVVKINDGVLPNLESKYIGSYQNEGFGKVVYNLDILDKVDEDYETTLDCKVGCDDPNNPSAPSLSDVKSNLQKAVASSNDNSAVFSYILNEISEIDKIYNVYSKVNAWVRDNKGYFDGRFKSQWGTIRAIVTNLNTVDEIKFALYDENNPKAYLTHGVAKDKWIKGGRLNKFKAFIEDEDNAIDDSNVRIAIINLASEMQKNKED